MALGRCIISDGHDHMCFYIYTYIYEIPTNWAIEPIHKSQQVDTS